MSTGSSCETSPSLRRYSSITALLKLKDMRHLAPNAVHVWRGEVRPNAGGGEHSVIGLADGSEPHNNNGKIDVASWFVGLTQAIASFGDDGYFKYRRCTCVSTSVPACPESSSLLQPSTTHHPPPSQRSLSKRSTLRIRPLQDKQHPSIPTRRRATFFS